MYVAHRSAGIGDIPNKCHWRQCIRFTCQVQSAKAPSNPRLVIKPALFSRPPCAEDTVCVLKTTACGFLGGEWKAPRKHLSVRSVRELCPPHWALLTLHNALNSTQCTTHSPRVCCSPLIYTVTNPGPSNTHLSQLASHLGSSLKSLLFPWVAGSHSSVTTAKTRICSSLYLGFTSGLKWTVNISKMSLEMWSWWWQGYLLLWLWGGWAVWGEAGHGAMGMGVVGNFASVFFWVCHLDFYDVSYWWFTVLSLRTLWIQEKGEESGFHIYHGLSTKWLQQRHQMLCTRIFPGLLHAHNMCNKVPVSVLHLWHWGGRFGLNLCNLVGHQYNPWIVTFIS